MTRAPKIGTSSPIPDTLMMYDHSNHLLTHHSNQLLTHSLKIPAKIESPRCSLRWLWGLIKGFSKQTRRGSCVGLCILSNSARKRTWCFLQKKGKCREAKERKGLGAPGENWGFARRGTRVLTPLDRLAPLDPFLR